MARHLRTRLLLCIICLSAAGVVSGQTAVPRAEAEEALAFHNRVRLSVGAPPLSWSEELSTYAQAWAEQLAVRGCRMEHRPRSGPWAQRFGENLFFGRGGTYTARSASEAWYSEVTDYRYARVSASNFVRTGHYTQMVWRGTERLGMGQAVCPDGAVIIVANYDPPGNVIGQFPY